MMLIFVEKITTYFNFVNCIFSNNKTKRKNCITLNACNSSDKDFPLKRKMNTGIKICKTVPNLYKFK